jgi:hypothetical protein
MKKANEPDFKKFIEAIITMAQEKCIVMSTKEKQNFKACIEQLAD